MSIDIFMSDYVIYVGRFHPFHIGHLHVLRSCLHFGNVVYLFIGCKRLPDSDNPFSFDERVSMVRSCLSGYENSRVFCVELFDCVSDDDWIDEIFIKLPAVLHSHGVAGSGLRPLSNIPHCCPP